jgi:transketolase
MNNPFTDIFTSTGYISRKTIKYFENRLNFKDRKIDDVNLTIVAEMIRFNTVLSIARAGTGHIGASLSMVEVITEIYYRTFPVVPEDLLDNDRNIFVLSKGHAVPALYSLLAAKGFIGIEKLDQLRRLHGLPGHADISISGIEASTGSLGMGISKSVGFAIAKKRNALKGNVVAVVGDGELQEGQCWESILSASSYKCDNLYIVIDANKIQTDREVKEIVNYHNLPGTLKTLGFAVCESDGRNISEINKGFRYLKKIPNKPKVLYCRTIKGQGISFMESNPRSKILPYIWHNKPPDLSQLKVALTEIVTRLEKMTTDLRIDLNTPNHLTNIPIEPVQKEVKGDLPVKGFSKGLLKAASINDKIVVFDGDLEEDCGLIEFHTKYPERFYEMGIMEQHMVSTACAFSKLGFWPVVITYAAFLTSRANEQIYNFVSENRKALFVGNMSGIIPATPGKSHQAFRDIACMKSIPKIKMYQPINIIDAENIVRRYFDNELGHYLYLRLPLAASSEILPVPSANLKLGQPQVIKKGRDIIIIGIGPVILGEIMKASNNLQKEGINIEVWNFPWINYFDYECLSGLVNRKLPILTVEDHFLGGGFGESLVSYLSDNNLDPKQLRRMGLKSIPVCGFRDEVLNSCGLNQASIERNVKEMLGLK